MKFIEEEKDLLFLSLNNIIKDHEKWDRLETNDKYYFLTTYKKLSKNDNSQFNISNKLLDILKDYSEEFLFDEVFLSHLLN
mgnify:CR=1 FL=1|tara:strand:+ start:484 stop:726 length:243 start_codon:yes stop_codon:yes gene_type:complete